MPMLEKFELFYGALRFSPLWLAVDLLLILHFFTAWFFSWRKTGWKLDFWWLTLFFQFFIFILMMYPVNASIFNMASVNGEMGELSHFDRAFSISVLGYVFLWVGRYLHDGLGKKILFLPLRKVMSGIEMIITERLIKICLYLFGLQTLSYLWSFSLFCSSRA